MSDGRIVAYETTQTIQVSIEVEAYQVDEDSMPCVLVTAYGYAGVIPIPLDDLEAEKLAALLTKCAADVRAAAAESVTGKAIAEAVQNIIAKDEVS